MTDETIIDQQPTDRVTRRDLIEGKISKVLDADRTGSVQVTSGLKFENAFQIAEAAKQAQALAAYARAGVSVS